MKTVKKIEPIESKEIKKYLNERIVYDCQSLDYAFINWLYPRLCKFADIVPLECSKQKFDVNGIKLSLSECVNRMIILCKKCLREFKENGFSSKFYDIENELFKMWEITRYDLWYY